VKKLNLNHDKTPAKLTEINQQLDSQLSNDELDDKKLRALIESRDAFIISHLGSLNDIERRSFAELEMQSNDTLSKLISNQLSDSLTQLTGLLRGKKAVNKYK